MNYSKIFSCLLVVSTLVLWFSDQIGIQIVDQKEEVIEENHAGAFCSHTIDEALDASYLIEEQNRIQSRSLLRHQLLANEYKIKIPVVYHRFAAEVLPLICGDYTSSDAEINAEIAATNAVYANHNFNVELVLLEIQLHNDNRALVFDDLICGVSEGFEEDDEYSFWETYAVPGALNFFCVDPLSPSDEYAYKPNGFLPNMIVLKHYNDGWSTVHHLGHTFNLWHTFEGDNIEDTEPTINLHFLHPDIVTPTDPNCIIDNCACDFVWTDPANNNLTLNSDVWDNIMNHGSRDCARKFTQGQIDHMWDGLLTKINLNHFDFCLLPGIGNCPSTALLQGIIEGGQIVTTSTSIDATQTYNLSNQTHRLESKEINLKPGFEITSGSKMEIRAIPCNCD